MEKGKVVPDLPPRGGRFARIKHLYDWQENAKLARENAGSFVLVETGVPVSHINSLRQYKDEPFNTDDGSLEISYRGSKVDANGVRRGDLYLKWVPKVKEQE